MSSAFWQIKRQTEQFAHGGTLTQKIKEYTKTWEERCYCEGIPDEVSAKLAKANRAPSWKQIALLILQNDHKLSGLGFGRKESALVDCLRRDKAERDSSQIRFNGI
jgi:predicted phosphoadenosine phosphosulfate sulfurtransferase